MKRKIEKHREKVLRCDSMLQKNQFVIPVPSSTLKKSTKKHKGVSNTKEATQGSLKVSKLSNIKGFTSFSPSPINLFKNFLIYYLFHIMMYARWIQALLLACLIYGEIKVLYVLCLLLLVSLSFVLINVVIFTFPDADISKVKKVRVISI